MKGRAKHLNIIVAADKNWAIGYQNSLLVRCPSDQKRFREITTGKVVVMGRRTLESFPQKQPLKNRTNIILTTDKKYSDYAQHHKDCIVVSSMEMLFEVLKPYPSQDIYIIGGERVYKELLPYCSKAYVTRIDYAYQADAFFPNLDNLPEWELVEESEEQTYFDLEYVFAVYQKK